MSACWEPIASFLKDEGFDAFGKGVAWRHLDDAVEAVAMVFFPFSKTEGRWGVDRHAFGIQGGIFYPCLPTVYEIRSTPRKGFCPRAGECHVCIDALRRLPQPRIPVNLWNPAADGGNLHALAADALCVVQTETKPTLDAYADFAHFCREVEAEMRGTWQPIPGVAFMGRPELFLGFAALHQGDWLRAKGILESALASGSYDNDHPPVLSYRWNGQRRPARELIQHGIAVASAHLSA